MAAELGWPKWPGFAEDAMAALEAYQWPGNVRELRNVVERGVYRWNNPEMSVADIVFDPFESPWGPLPSADKPTDTSDEIQFVIPRQEQPSPLNDVRDFRSAVRSEEHTSELQSLMRIPYAVFCLHKKNNHTNKTPHNNTNHNPP